MRWVILSAALTMGATHNVDAAPIQTYVPHARRMPAAQLTFKPSPVAAPSCAAGCSWGQYGPCPACAKRTRWAYHGPYYRRPFDYRRSFDFPWSYAPYRPATYWVSDEASGPVDVVPPPPK